MIEFNKYVFAYIQKANNDINPAKSSGYGLDPNIDYYEDEVSKWIKKYTVDGGSSIFGCTPTIADYLNNDEELLNILGLSVDKKTGKLKIENENNLVQNNCTKKVVNITSKLNKY